MSTNVVLSGRLKRKGKEPKRKGGGKKRHSVTGKRSDVGWKNRKDSGLSKSAGGNKTTKYGRRKMLRSKI
jgi:hypothetical protein